MEHLWTLCKLFFDWIPQQLPHQMRHDGDFFLVVPDINPELLHLNSGGAFIFEHCDGQRTFKDILTSYMVHYLRSDRGPAAYEVLKVIRMLEYYGATVFIPPELATTKQLADHALLAPCNRT